MFTVKTCRYLLGTKIPFTQYPEIVQTFLSQNGLHYQNFYYYFQDNYGGLQKALKDCPSLGSIHTYAFSNIEELFLSNIDEATTCTEKEIMDLMPKIYRRYGFTDTYLCYQDIDFCSLNIPSVIRRDGNLPRLPRGSGICCSKDGVFPRWNSINLHVIVHDGTRAYDASAYFASMDALLPNARKMEYMDTYFTDEEQLFYDNLNETAKPMVSDAEKYLKACVPEHPDRNIDSANPPKLPTASILKRLCKKYGFEYVKYEYFSCFIQKRTDNGHYLLLDANISPNSRFAGITANFAGMGFSHRILTAGLTPQNAEELENFFELCFQSLNAAEKEVLPPLSAHYPATPEWYIP